MADRVRRWMTADARGYEQLKAYAREMRKGATVAEDALWQAIRNGKIEGFKFRRQHIIGHFIADLVCLDKKLVIELDGGYHQLPEVELADQERTEILEAAGYTVLRFQNEEVIHNLPAILDAIKAELKNQKLLTETQTQRDSPPPWGGARGGAIPLPSREGRGGAYISAKNKLHIDQLKAILYDKVVSSKVSMDNPIISNARHFEALEKSYASLSDVLTGMDQGITSDFVAMDIRRALSYLGEVTGEVTTEDLLGNIFSRFCIGK